MTWQEQFQTEVRRALRGRPVSSVATSAGLPRDAVRSVLHGHDPRLSRVGALADALGIELHIGPPHDRPRTAPEPALPAAGLTTRESPPPQVEASVRTLVEWVTDAGGNPLPEDFPLGYAEDQRESAAGGGALFDRETAVGCLAFRRTWLDQHAIDAKLAAIISVRGESMEPTLPHGSAILVDRGRRRRREDRVFVVRTEDGLVVKRVGKDRDGHWQLRSDNPTWDPVPWPLAADVIGEVRWMARTLG